MVTLEGCAITFKQIYTELFWWPNRGWSHLPKRVLRTGTDPNDDGSSFSMSTTWSLGIPRDLHVITVLLTSVAFVRISEKAVVHMS